MPSYASDRHRVFSKHSHRHFVVAYENVEVCVDAVVRAVELAGLRGVDLVGRNGTSSFLTSWGGD